MALANEENLPGDRHLSRSRGFNTFACPDNWDNRNSQRTCESSTRERISFKGFRHTWCKTVVADTSPVSMTRIHQVRRTL